MEFVMGRFRKVFGVSLLSAAACLGTYQLLDGYEHPLTVSAIHEAYVLGVRNDQATAHFLNPYILQCSAPPQSCFATEVEVLTPFAQVVELSHRNATSGYTEQQAAEDIRQRGDVIIVQVTLMLPAAYAEAAQNTIENSVPAGDANAAALRPENFWEKFHFALKQHGEVIATRSFHSKPIYSAAAKDVPSVLDGATVWLEYNAKDVVSEETTLEVVTAESKKFSVSFDLKTLR
jgi:hypothetical protein